MKRSISKYGACYILTLSLPRVDKTKRHTEAELAKLAAEVNRLFNYGIVSNIPEDYDPKKDGNVSLLTDEARLTNGLIAMATNHLVKRKLSLAFKGKKGGGRFMELVHATARNLRERFEVEASHYNNPTTRAGGIFGVGEIHDFGTTQEFSTGA